MQNGPAGLTTPDIFNGYCGCDSLEGHPVSERDISPSELLLIDIPLLPAISSSVVKLACKDKMPRDCQLLRQILLKPVKAERKKMYLPVSSDCTYSTTETSVTYNMAKHCLALSSLAPPSLLVTHVPIIYGCLVVDQLISGNPLVNRVLDTLPIDLHY